MNEFLSVPVDGHDTKRKISNQTHKYASVTVIMSLRVISVLEGLLMTFPPSA